MTGDRNLRLTAMNRGGLRGLLLLTCTLLFAGAPAHLYGQMDEPAAPSANGVTFDVFAGVLQPTANLTVNEGSFGTTINPDLAIGGQFTIWASNVVGVGVTGLFSPANLGVFATQFQGAIPDDLGKATYMAGTLDLTFRIRSSGSAGSLEPYVVLGGGVRRLDVDAIASPEVEDSTDPTASLGLGVRVNVAGGVWMRGEVRNYASLYESPASGDSRLQNDVAITIGFGIR